MIGILIILFLSWLTMVTNIGHYSSLKAFTLMSPFWGSQVFCSIVVSISASITIIVLYKKLEENKLRVSELLGVGITSLFSAYVITWIISWILWSLLTNLGIN